MSKPLLTRKDIALMTGLHVRTLARNEQRWGLHRARVNFGTRSVFYRHAQTVQILSSIGILMS